MLSTRTVKNNSYSKQLCGAAHLFLYISMPLFCRLRRETFVQKLPAYNWFHVLWGKCRTCPCSLFFHWRTWRSFSPYIWWPLAFLIFSPPLQNFHVVLLTKQVSLMSFISPSPPLPLSLSLLSSFIAFFPSHHMKFFPAFFLGIDDFLYHF